VDPDVLAIVQSVFITEEGGEKLEISRQLEYFPDWGEYRPSAQVHARRMERPFTIKDVHGDKEGREGDYLCANAAGHFWTVPAEHFEATYELVQMRSEDDVSSRENPEADVVLQMPGLDPEE
jgi:hypothetical protein